MVNGNVTEEKYKAENYKEMIHFKKKKSDKAVPKQIDQLKQRYQHMKDRAILTHKNFFLIAVYTKTTSQRNLLKSLFSLMRALEEDLKTKLARLNRFNPIVLVQTV